MRKIKNFLPYAGGFLGTAAALMAFAFAFGYVTHTGIFGN